MRNHRWMLAGMLDATLLMIAAPTAPADQCCSLQKESFDNYPTFPNVGVNCNVYNLAQSFVVTESYTLCGVCVVLSPAGGSTATLYVQNTPDDNPSVIYTSATRNDIGAEDWYCFDVPDYDLDAGEAYYIRVASPSPGVMWRRYQDTSGGDPYPRGGAYEDGVYIDSVAPGHTDYWFACYTYGWATVNDLEEIESSWGAIKAMYR